MYPLVSILIPAYNAEKWIDATLQSALNQTWANTEILVVDDGSTDATCRVVESYASAGVRLIRKSNGGAANARNVAFRSSRGEFIQWLDADDLLSPDKISMQVESIRKGSLRHKVASCGWGLFRYRTSAATFSRGPLWESLDPVEWTVRKWNGNFHMQTATWLVSRELTESAGPWNERLLGDDDGEYFCRILMLSDGTLFIDGPRVYYRITGTSRLSYIGGSPAKIDAQFHGMKLQIQYLLDRENSARTRQACIKYLQTWLIHFHPERPDIVAEAFALAKSLGGVLALPTLPRKYSWAVRLFGLSRAKRIQLLYNARKTSAIRLFDYMLSTLQKQ